jgi:hypothetical protein
VLLTRSLFGSLGIIPVLMFGLYVFWLFVLVGGQISYAVQNVHVRNSRLAWGSLSAANRERLSLAVLMAVCRRFHARQPAISVPELSNAVRLPVQVVNECLNRIVDAGLRDFGAGTPGLGSAEAYYQPSRPLNRITFFDFKEAADNLGADPAGDSLDKMDPAVRNSGRRSSMPGARVPAKIGRGDPQRRTRLQLNVASPVGALASDPFSPHDFLDPAHLPAPFPAHLCDSSDRHGDPVHLHDRLDARHRAG